MKSWMLFPLPLTAFCALPAVAATTNVAQVVDAVLAKYGPVPVTVVRQIHTTDTVCIPGHFVPAVGMVVGGGCRKVPITEQRSQTEQRVLRATNIRIISVAPLIWGSSTSTELPETLTGGNTFGQACLDGAASLTVNYTLALAFARTATIQLSKSISHTESRTVQFSVGVERTFNVGGSLTFGTTTTESQVHIDSTQAIDTQTRAGTFQVDRGNADVVQIRAWPVKYTIPFRTTVVVDADLSQNDKGLKLLSDILPRKAQRTFSIAGSVISEDASDAYITEFRTPYDPSRCAMTATKSVVLHRFEIPSSLKLIQLPREAPRANMK